MSSSNTRCTFAIISHPDAGKTTITEKLLLFGGAINLAGTIKGRKSSRHATSDWMQLEQQRGISVTTSVMQFPYKQRVFNLLDTPGHEDFSEDTYRTLTAVDSALMVIDAVKGVEPRTVKLMQVCRLRNTPIFTFINKLDRDSRCPLELLDEIESILNIKCAPLTWPLGSGREFKGVYHLFEDKIYLFNTNELDKVNKNQPLILPGHKLDRSKLDPILLEIFDESRLLELKQELDLVQGASVKFDVNSFLDAKQTPVFFGSALNNFGVELLLNFIAEHAPGAGSRESIERVVLPNEEKFSGFIFKIQANMDPNHRDRIAFLRICSGKFDPQQKIYHVRSKRYMQARQAMTFLAGSRNITNDLALPGDIIGLPNHGQIHIGDSFTSGEELKFIGIPYFAPELFRLVRAKDPLKTKSLKKGLDELSEEGATQVFKPINRNQIILGAVGVLQFDVVAHRLELEYKADPVYESVDIYTVRWIICEDPKVKEQLSQNLASYLAIDHSGALAYLAPNRAHLQLTLEKFPQARFLTTREH